MTFFSGNSRNLKNKGLEIVGICKQKLEIRCLEIVGSELYLLILPKNLEMPSRRTPKIPRFKINVSMCECCCPFFMFSLFFAFQRKLRILTTQKWLTTMYLVNFYRWFQSTTLSDHLSFFSLLGNLWSPIKITFFDPKKALYQEAITKNIKLWYPQNHHLKNLVHRDFWHCQTKQHNKSPNPSNFQTLFSSPKFFVLATALKH